MPVTHLEDEEYDKNLEAIKKVNGKLHMRLLWS